MLDVVGSDPGNVTDATEGQHDAAVLGRSHAWLVGVESPAPLSQLPRRPNLSPQDGGVGTRPQLIHAAHCRASRTPEGSAIANSQPLIDPFATNLDLGQGIGVDAAEGRHGVGSLSAPSTGATYGFTSGVFPGGTSGAGPSNDLQVLPGGGMAVTTNAGGYAIERGSLGVYIGAATASITITLDAANPSNPRIDYIIIRNREPATDGVVTESARLMFLKGEPATQPAEPSGQLTSGDLLLAAVRVRAATTSVTATDLTDKRRFVVARGGITPRVGGDNRDGSYEGQYRDNVAFKTLDRWSGSDWQPVAAPSEWIQWTPRLECTGTFAQIGMGSGARRVGRFQLVGKRLDFSYEFKWGSPPFNGGTGDIFTRLPTHPYTGQTIVGIGHDQWVESHLFTNTPQWKGSFTGDAMVRANDNAVIPYFGLCHGHFPPNFLVDMNTYPYRIATTQGAAATGVPRIFNPNGYPEGGSLLISGSVECRFL